MNKYFIKWQYQRLCESQAQLPPGVEILKDVKFAATDDLAEVFLKLLQTVFESMADAKTGALDKNCAGRLVLFTDGDGAGSMHWNLMSGEALTEGSVRYTLKPTELHQCMPVEMEFLIFKTVEEIGKSAETLQQALDAVKGRKIEIFSDGQFYRASRIRTVKLPAGEGDKWIMCAELFLEETEAPAVGAEIRADRKLKVDPNTAGGFVDESDTIEDWARYCEDTEKDTAGNIDAVEFVEARGLDESRICRMVKDLTRGEVQARRLCEALVETADIMALRRRLDRAGLGFGYSLRESADLGRYEGRLCITDTGRFMTWFG